jgi:hypothetical protein
MVLRKWGNHLFLAIGMVVAPISECQTSERLYTIDVKEQRILSIIIGQKKDLEWF